MNSLEIMRRRRSIRNYNGEEIPGESLTKVLRTGLLPTSGRTKRPWEFIVVCQRKTLDNPSGCRAGDVKMPKEAQYVIVVTGDRKEQDVRIKNYFVAMTNMHLTTSSLGIGDCWIQDRLRNTDEITTEGYVGERLGFPENYKLRAILIPGMPDAEAPVH